MRGKSKECKQSDLFRKRLENLINLNHPLCLLAKEIKWDEIDMSFAGYYSEHGRASNPVRLMVGLLILKHMYNLSDEVVVAKWVENPYYQYFCGEIYFQWEFPTHPTDLVHFRHRIGEEGVTKILKLSIDLHGKKAKEAEVLIDTTVQEKNITFPTDVKQYFKIIKHCVKIAKTEEIVLRQSYKRVSKKMILAQRNKRHPKNHKKAYAAQRKLKTIAGRLLRELERKLAPEVLLKYSDMFDIFNKVLLQKRGDKNKIYSLHEKDVYCMSKGKDHKKYEYGSKVSIVVTKKSGIIVGAMNFKENKYDGHTLPEVIQQCSELVGVRPKVAICDRGYRGMSECEGTQIKIPKPPKKSAKPYDKRKARERFRRRAGIEPIIGHLKFDHRLSRNFLKGIVGDSVNVILAAAAFNFKKWMRQVHFFLFHFQNRLFYQILA